MFYSIYKKIKNRVSLTFRDRILPNFSKKLYWDMRGKTFKNEWGGYQVQYYEQHWLLKDMVEKLKPTSILDAGCGFGRNTKFLIEECGVEPSAITAFDFSKSMIKEAEKFLGNDFNKLNDIRQADILNMPFQKDSFDLVLIHGVMMHIDFKNEPKAINEVLRVAKKDIIQIEEYYENKINENINEYTYCHNYKKLYKNIEIIELENKGLLMFRAIK
ncbi:MULTISPECIES: class I SAM-dependent methyltransferase [Aliarcobacter]|uniref:class I SAM-dependent methyltransferase n=1 Tax=Aliarcobacter TaxID=2321111 RepID=UPI00082F821D|nr:MULTISPECIES: class I SAM-dependent methyltransferase [Aliarcobacter]MCT7527163.1 class I SAM-dependent methyltransferase [Aliarcobacter cryaerophilus]